MKNKLEKGYLRALGVILLVVVGAFLAACGGTSSKNYTIGFVNVFPNLSADMDGFKARMTELGYTEGKNITYVYKGVIDSDAKVVDAEVQRLLTAKVDMLVTMGTPAHLSAKKAVAGKGIPVLFISAIDPVGTGLVASVDKPGGDVTGGYIPYGTPDTLNWLLKVVPGTKSIYVPYNPADVTSASAVKPLPDAAAKAGIALTQDKVTSVDKAVANIKTLPKTTAVLFVPSPTLESGRNVLRKTVNERGNPSIEYALLESDALLCYGTNKVEEGKQVADLADKVFKGAKPGDLAVAPAQYFTVINMKTAKLIGLNISDSILSQASNVVR